MNKFPPYSRFALDRFYCIIYTLKISIAKTKATAVKGKMNVRTKIVINNNTTEQVSSFNYLGHTIKLTNKID
jgi:hypothetical protein